MAKQYLDIDNCIVEHDVKQIKKEPAGKKIKTKNQLAKILVKRQLIQGTESAVYHRMYRFENDGFATAPQDLIDAILKVLEVDKSDLIKSF